MTQEEQKLHAEYEKANDLVRAVVDSAFKAVYTAILSTGMDAAQDDRAEILVSQIYKYVIDSATETQWTR